ncbi:MAG TPA: S-methyl-5-thioribose-1-phosphate isomerase, partial [Vitreimonas sp.]|nr:S-methyl-5-thioribose-1-phosphate isomerase [Vitreimonas sp.]
PEAVVHWRLSSVADVVAAIGDLAVRGAPAIGIAGAYGVVVGIEESGAGTAEEAIAAVESGGRRIEHARPTAVNLSWAVRRVQGVAREAASEAGATAATVRDRALVEAIAIQEEDRLACAAIGEHGRRLLQGRRRILTHCNTGRLATGGDGTALAAIYAKHAAGELDEVIACEARPLLQGGRLTAWELGAAGVPHRLIVDGAAGMAMARGLVEAVIVGCDRVAANGDTANKIGTYSLAVLARRHGIPFFVAGPSSTFDLATPNGEGIVVEERAADEIRGFSGRAVAPATVEVWNPAFDVTPADLIDAFVTEVGVIEPPFDTGIPAALARSGSAEVAR